MSPLVQDRQLTGESITRDTFVASGSAQRSSDGDFISPLLFDDRTHSRKKKSSPTNRILPNFPVAISSSPFPFSFFFVPPTGHPASQRSLTQLYPRDRILSFSRATLGTSPRSIRSHSA